MSRKKGCIIMVIVGAIICMIIEFACKEYYAGVLSGLTIIVPVAIWFVDKKENEVSENG